MPRTYLRAAATLVAGLLGSALNPTAELQARALFDSKPLPQERFAVLARPVGRDNWKLLVLEQIKQRPRCWTPRPDGLIDPSLNNFNLSHLLLLSSLNEGLKHNFGHHVRFNSIVTC